MFVLLALVTEFHGKFQCEFPPCSFCLCLLGVCVQGDVAATRLALDRRRRILTVELHKRSGTASAAAMAAMIREARRIGMGAEAAELERHLRQRQQHLQVGVLDFERKRAKHYRNPVTVLL